MTQMFRSPLVCLVLVATLSIVTAMGCKSDVPSKFTNVSGPRIEKTTEKGPVKLTIRLAPEKPRLADMVEMEVLVTASDDVSIDPPAFGQAVGNFLIVDYSERKVDMTGNAIDKNQRLFHYTLEPTHSGQHLIHSLAIFFTDNRPDSEARGERTKIISDPFEVTVTSELGNEVPDLADLEPMAAPRSISRPWSWIWIIPSTLLVLLFAWLIWFTRTKPGAQPKIVLQSPAEIAQQQLAQLLAEDLPAKGLVKEFYLRLTGIVRQYIEGTTGLRAPEQTTEEFLNEVKSRSFFSGEQSVRLQDFLEAADMVKYAGQEPTSDQISTSIVRAREFIAMQPLPVSGQPSATIDPAGRPMLSNDNELATVNESPSDGATP